MPSMKNIWKLLGVLILSVIILGGCSTKYNPFRNWTTVQLEEAETAFLQGDYDRSRKSYQQILIYQSQGDAYQSASYGLVFNDMATADTVKAFTQAATTVLTPEAVETYSGESQKMLIIAFSHGLSLIEARHKAAETKISQLSQKAKKYEEDQTKMQELLDTLKHQISVLEKIEQERQKKRKTQ